MSELRVGEFVESSRSGDGEVAPHVLRRPEVELLDSTGRRLEALVGVLRSDSSSDHVT